MVDIVQILNDKTSLALRYQVATGFAMPAIIPVKETVSVKNKQSIEADQELKTRLTSGLEAISEVNYQVPVTLKLDSQTEGFTLPVDPIIGLSGKNMITRRYVSKSKASGSIKERWSQDDWEVTINGVLIAENAADLGSLCQTLREMCENGKKGLSITCDLLNNYMGIQRLAIETYDFPFTKGVENQAFSIKAYSDAVYSLLIEL